MVQLRSKIKRALIHLLNEMNSRELRETATYALFLKTRSCADPAQAYFWTAKWQALERRVHQDQQRGRLLGDGTVGSLLRALKA